MWEQIDNENALETYGSEGGTILKDEKYNNTCQITLEKGGIIAPFSITCGIYGLMVHTAFADNIDNAIEKYTKMKIELQKFIDSNFNIDDSYEWCKKFAHKY